ncbi:MAG TPA: hypothetical protein VN223_04160 [Candidatus Elarobacter sp.]|nr:hypothetical protein [Candidatus Elarobacter sp.]
MAKIMASTKRRKEHGMALLLALFALLLLSGIGLCMVLATTTETRIDANYSGSLRSYYAARSGLEEVRDRINFPSTSPISPNGLADLLPQDIAGNAGGVLYILNPVGGETVDPTDTASPYFDDQLCHDYNSSVASRDSKCTAVPATANWNNPLQYAAAAATPLGYKWVRINIKTNRIAAPYFVDQIGAAATLDSRICWDGQAEQLSPGGPNPSCDANGMQTVYMLSSLAATAQTGGPNGSRKFLRLEVVPPSIRPPGMITMGALPASAMVTNPQPVLSGLSIPSIAIDGRAHKIDGTLGTTASCSSVAPLGADSTAGTTQIETALNTVRKNIVTSANNSCKADGTAQNGKICTPGLWWVRGTDANSRFATTTSSNGGNGRGDDDDHGGGHDHHRDPSGVGDAVACDPSTASCYTNLDLAAPELMATSATSGLHTPLVTTPADGTAPFTGADGNQADESVYQPGSANVVGNSIKAVNDLVSTSSGQPNYYAVSAAGLAGNYGTSTSPALVVITDPVLTLQGNAVLSGYGVLVVPSGLEIGDGISGTLNWNGIVVVNSPSGHVTINSGANGFINGALLVQPGAAINLQNTTTSFKLTYSCEAIDLPFSSKPFRIISTSETSF